MELTIFAKKRKTKDGKDFTSYFTKLTKKSGEEITTSVKFREDCGAPKREQCPMNIIVDKGNANFVEKGVTYTDAEGVEKDAIDRTLWIAFWEEGTPYVDKSLDDFDL